MFSGASRKDDTEPKSKVRERSFCLNLTSVAHGSLSIRVIHACANVYCHILWNFNAADEK